jgi:CTP synthase
VARYVFVTGGVVSSLGKGIAAASLGFLLKSRGLRVTLQKLDPYLNVDPGTMSPFQHGEVYVTDDGAETDLDLGHYERFTDVSLARNNNVTAGQIYDAIIAKERRGDFLGGTVQVIPHVTDEIKRRMRLLAEEDGVDVSIVEVGGTVGDIESLPFLEAIRQLRLELGRDRTVFIHVTLVPFIKAAQEIKTKPSQHSVRELREIGIQPDILLCRTEIPLSREVRAKLALFTNVALDAVIEARDVDSIYEVPLMFHEGGLDGQVTGLLGLDAPEPDLAEWSGMLERIQRPGRGELTIAVVGKYTHLRDAYKSISEAIVHAGIANDVRPNIAWVDSEEIERAGPAALLAGAHGILIPGGFGDRGIEGKIQAVRHARESGTPFFGICLGFHCAAIEFARDVLNLPAANSTEFNSESPDPVISLMPKQRERTQMGGSMRLGAYPCRLAPGSRARDAYGSADAEERHRHRFEFNRGYQGPMAAHGFVATGICPSPDLVEIMEHKDHPWFVAVQFHPELKSRPHRAHPLFREFIRHALLRRDAEGPAT